MEEGFINLTFSEVVNSDSFDPTKFIVTNNEGSNVRLVNSTTEGVNGLTVAVILSDYDLFHLKIEPEVATRKPDTYLYFEQGAITDAVGNQIDKSQPRMATQFSGKTIYICLQEVYKVFHTCIAVISYMCLT